jgi:hypothetical protein
MRSLIAPPGSALGIRHLLRAVLFGVIVMLPIWAAPRFGTDPLVALFACLAVWLTFFVVIFVLSFVPVRVSTESSEVYPGPAEPLFQITTDIKHNLQVTGGPRKLVSQTGEPGQPGSSYVTEQPGLVLTTTVVSSDPPRKILTTISGPGILRTDRERTYTPVAEGTLLEQRTRQRMGLLSWLLLHRPAVKRATEAEAARVNAAIRDYLAAGAANTISIAD